MEPDEQMISIILYTAWTTTMQDLLHSTEEVEVWLLFLHSTEEVGVWLLLQHCNQCTWYCKPPSAWLQSPKLSQTHHTASLPPEPTGHRVTNFHLTDFPGHVLKSQRKPASLNASNAHTQTHMHAHTHHMYAYLVDCSWVTINFKPSRNLKPYFPKAWYIPSHLTDSQAKKMLPKQHPRTWHLHPHHCPKGCILICILQE